MIEKSYLDYLNKLVDQSNKILIIILLAKILMMLIILLWLKKLRQNLKQLHLKLMMELELLNTKIVLVKITPKIDQKKCLLFILSWNLIHGRIELKIKKGKNN